MRSLLRLVAVVACAVSYSFSPLAADREYVASQTAFPTFWNKFKSAVATADKSSVAWMTKFPFEIYASHIRNRAEFVQRYNEIFKGEANAAQCFGSVEPQKESAQRYAIYCPFKEAPNDKENAPIRFIFELTKSGWKFSGLDNINE